MHTATLRSAVALLALLIAAPLAQAQVRVTADITTNTTWTPDNEYLLDGLVFVDNNATLTIEPGTVVRGVRDDRITTGEGASALVVRRGSRLVADGLNPDGSIDPIIFTAEDDDLSDPGDFLPTDRGEWAGIILLGRASTNQPTTDNQIEGIDFDPAQPVSATNQPALFGGTEDADDSGIIRYVSIRYSGFSISGIEGDEIQGLTLGGVGSGTLIDYIEIFSSNDDGIEFFGGTVNVKHAAVLFPFDDAFDYDMGWRGNGQYWFTLAGLDAAGRGGEHDGGDDGGDDAMPFAIPVISNATYIGAGETEPANGDGNDWAFRMRDGAGGFYCNSIFTQFPDRAIDLENFSDVARVDSYTQFENGRLKIENNVFWDFGRGDTFDDISDAGYSEDNPPAGGDAFDDAFATYLADNNVLQNPGIFVQRDDLNSDGTPDTVTDFNPVPQNGTLPGADFSASELTDFFDEVSYVGAFEPRGDGTTWLDGWSFASEGGFVDTPVQGTPTRGAFGLRAFPNPASGAATVAITLER
ncbi:MAG: T9SS C-terminal target domain-containing protein, partial [Bacteroidota bacterium]